MGKVYDSVDQRLREWLLAQHLFFVGTAPSGPDGHVNVSPKGLAGSFAVTGPRSVAYIDFTGSGIETIAHLRDNGRIVLMFCAFDGPPKIVRLHGHGEAVLPDDARFAALTGHFPDFDPTGLRSIITVDVDRVSDSCGWGVPLMEHRKHREALPRNAARAGEPYLADYRAEFNARSIDGLPGLPT
jgi:hypothetical protein